MKRGFGARAACARSKASVALKERRIAEMFFDGGQIFSPFPHETPPAGVRAANACFFAPVKAIPPGSATQERLSCA